MRVPSATEVVLCAVPLCLHSIHHEVRERALAALANLLSGHGENCRKARVCVFSASASERHTCGQHSRRHLTNLSSVA